MYIEACRNIVDNKLSISVDKHYLYWSGFFKWAYHFILENGVQIGIVAFEKGT